MILMFEMTYSGTTHAPGNSQLAQIVARAMPHHQLRIHADAAHCHELSQDPDLVALANVRFEPIALPAVHRGAVNVVSAARFGHEFRTIRAALAAVPRHEPCLIILASSTGTEIRAARLAARLAAGFSGQPAGVLVALHGYLNSAMGWRSGNPLARRFDLRSMLETSQVGLRYLVFEDSIRRELARLVPATASCTDTLPLPVNTSELSGWRPVPLALPLQVGLVGIATEAKGITPFLETARMFRQRHGDKVAFHIVGSRLPGSDPAQFRDIAHEVPVGQVPRAAFLERLAGLHYVFLPMQQIYYGLSASGALLDAVTWLKPVIATRLPIVADMFEAGGDIGHLCDDVAGMQSALGDILERMDTERYASQVESLRRLRASRAPEALVPLAARILGKGFPALVEAPARASP